MALQSINAYDVYYNAYPIEIDPLNTVGYSQDVTSQQVFPQLIKEMQQKLKSLLAESVVDLYGRDEAGDTPMHRAVRTGNAELVGAFVSSPHCQKSEVLNAVNGKGMTALAAIAFMYEDAAGKIVDKAALAHFLCSSDGHGSDLRNIMDMLVNIGADINHVHCGEAPLIQATRIGAINAMNLLLEKGANVNQAGKDGQTALMVGASQGRVDMVRALLAKGAYVNRVDKDENSALTLAAQKGYANIVKLLLVPGVNVNHADKDGFTALLWILSPDRINKSQINKADYVEDLDIVNALLAAGANVNQIGKGDDRSALMLAIAKRDLEIISALLAAGANVNYANCVETVLRYAIAIDSWFDSVDITKILLAAGANVNQICKPNGMTALLEAVSRSNVDAIKELLAAKRTPTKPI